MKAIPLTHILLDDQGRAWIDDTKVKVIEVVLDAIGNRMTPENIHEEYPHLSLAQIHAALSYYFDHKAELDAEIARQEKEYETLLQQNANSPIRQKLRSLGGEKLPL